MRRYAWFLFAVVGVLIAWHPAILLAAEVAEKVANPYGPAANFLTQFMSAMNSNTLTASLGISMTLREILEHTFMTWAPLWLKPLLPAIISLLGWTVTGISTGMPAGQILAGAVSTSGGTILWHKALGYIPALLAHVTGAGKYAPITPQYYQILVMKSPQVAALYNPDGSLKL